MTTSTGRPTDNLRLGALFAVLAALSFSIMAAGVKVAAGEVTGEQIVFFRCATSLVVLLPWLLRHGAAAVRTRRLGGHLWRAGFGTCAMFLFFYALAHLHLAEAMVLTYSTPLFIPFIAWMWIREPPPPVIFPAIALGLGGIVLIARPEAGLPVSLASVAGVLSGISAAGAMVSIRRIADTEPAPRVVFYFSALSTAISAVTLTWGWAPISARSLALLVGIGVLATLGQLCLTRAYALAPAARIGAFTYVAVVFSGLIGWLLWQERPDGSSLSGMALVVACCLLAGWRPRTRALKETA